MNAHQRHQVRRAAEREIAAAEARAVRAEEQRAQAEEWGNSYFRSFHEAEERAQKLEAERDRVAFDAAETEAQATRVRALVVELERDAEVLAQLCSVRADRIAVLEELVRRLQEQDHDAAKLRRRLQERGGELEQARARIRELEAAARTAASSAPMIDFHRLGGSRG